MRLSPRSRGSAGGYKASRRETDFPGLDYESYCVSIVPFAISAAAVPPLKGIAAELPPESAATCPVLASTTSRVNVSAKQPPVIAGAMFKVSVPGSPELEPGVMLPDKPAEHRTNPVEVIHVVFKSPPTTAPPEMPMVPTLLLKKLPLPPLPIWRYSEMPKSPVSGDGPWASTVVFVVF